MPADPFASLLMDLGVDPQALVMALGGCGLLAMGYALLSLVLKPEAK